MDRGSRELELAPADQALWDAAYHDLKTAV
jgi:hypothetical protein